VAESGRGAAPARAALAGNPSDGYGGAVLAVTVEAFCAEVVVAEGVRRSFTPSDAAALLDTTLARFHRDLAPDRTTPRVELATTIPRSVGLGGSSAIVIAALRALCDLHDVELPPGAMAELALSIERDDLGIAAGLQDRVAQSYGGATFMEFGVEPPRYERLDRAALPPLVVAWREHAAEDSGVVHSDLRARFDAGDAAVNGAMATLAEAARAARDALVSGDWPTLARCADASFDARARILPLDPRHVEMVEIARAAGAAANYTGSGGAIVAVCNDQRHRDAVALALSGGRCGTVVV
jgi:glucuronokinase